MQSFASIKEDSNQIIYVDQQQSQQNNLQQIESQRQDRKVLSIENNNGAGQNEPMLVIPSLGGGSDVENRSITPNLQLKVGVGPAEDAQQPIATGHDVQEDLEHTILKVDHHKRKQAFQALTGPQGSDNEDLELGITQAIRDQALNQMNESNQLCNELDDDEPQNDISQVISANEAAADLQQQRSNSLEDIDMAKGSQSNNALEFTPQPRQKGKKAPSSIKALLVSNEGSQ